MEDHLHICRRCKEPVAADGKAINSQSKYREALQAHRPCPEKAWASEDEMNHHEILTEAQQKVVLEWSLPKQKRLHGTSDDDKLWGALFTSLHGFPPSDKKLDARRCSRHGCPLAMNLPSF